MADMYAEGAEGDSGRDLKRPLETGTSDDSNGEESDFGSPPPRKRVKSEELGSPSEPHSLLSPLGDFTSLGQGQEKGAAPEKGVAPDGCGPTGAAPSPALGGAGAVKEEEEEEDGEEEEEGRLKRTATTSQAESAGGAGATPAAPPPREVEEGEEEGEKGEGRPTGARLERSLSIAEELKQKEQIEEELRRKKQLLVDSLSEAQLNRYEMYRRSSFPKAAIKRFMQSITGCGASHNVVIAMSGIAKVYVGEIVEEALDVLEQWGDTGPLQPKHIREAIRRLKSQDKVPSAKGPKPLFR